MEATFYRALRAASDSLFALKASYQPVHAALTHIAAMNGRLVVTGMGKSGHVARKIASTMSSLGTPSCFLNGGDASHGDMGLIQPDDVLLILSKSGESNELVPVAGRARALGVPILIITAQPKSFLALCAAVVFELPKFDEACHLGLAPTTSTICMAALGDALAIAASDQQSFTREEFAMLHPGGELGLQLIAEAIERSE